MKILMVCLGNICRSPLAQGILEHKLKGHNLNSWKVDSCGTSAWHIGEAPDQRSIEIAASKGLDISSQRARQLKYSDLDNFDLICVMDSSNYRDVIKHCQNQQQKEKVTLILNFASPGKNMAVPDPYYDNTFENVYHLLDKACNHLIIKYIDQKS